MQIQRVVVARPLGDLPAERVAIAPASDATRCCVPRNRVLAADRAAKRGAFGYVVFDGEFVVRG